MPVPLATYRLQFSGRFPIHSAREIIPYLHSLGISHLYASPLFQARPGSPHGYDGIDPRRWNPELGTALEFGAFFQDLKKHRLGLLLDFVSNHMAADPKNPWWKEVQNKGKASRFARFFDVRWGPGGKVEAYRRFFDIGELVGVRVEDPWVFQKIHRFLFRLIGRGRIQGLRIDHIDGLWDPAGYLNRLRKRSPRKIYTVVEKILTGPEGLPRHWEVEGTTGYDFLNEVNGWLVHPRGYWRLLALYRKKTGIEKSFLQLAFQQKKRIALELFPPEVEKLTGDFVELAKALSGKPVSRERARMAITATVSALRVYRTYIHRPPVGPRDRACLADSLRKAKQDARRIPKPLWRILEKILRLDFPKNLGNKAKRQGMEWVGRWQQLTGAVMAKGVEDTVFYQYFPLISLNEVGGNHRLFSNEAFHRSQRTRRNNWPYSLKATSTHDTKRSEDVRSRIHGLSELAGEWESRLEKWMIGNRSFKKRIRGEAVPDANEEIFLYQTLLGAWPFKKQDVPGFKKRMEQYLVKALREGKTHSHWIRPDETYEKAVLYYFRRVLSPKNKRFLGGFLEFQKKIAFYGFLNSLSQLVLKLTTPGIPDFYQGNELWDLSLVDPDNRRPVDFPRRTIMLERLRREGGEKRPALSNLLQQWEDGRLKLFMTFCGLDLRLRYPRLFQKGDYRPLMVSGAKKESVLSFSRRHREQWLWVVVPRFWTSHFPRQEKGFEKDAAWENSFVRRPPGMPEHWREAFSRKKYFFPKGKRKISLNKILSDFPFAVLVSG